MKSTIITLLLATLAFSAGCATTPEDITKLENRANIPKLSEIARNKGENAYIRKLSLESLARLKWKPSNDERLQVYSLFASPSDQAEAKAVMKFVSADGFAQMDKDVVDCASLISNGGQWIDTVSARVLYNKIRTSNQTIATISLCQQVVARPQLQTGLLLLSIKLALKGSESPLCGVLLEYGNKDMAEDYLNCGSSILSDGAYQWAEAHGYNVQRGYGSNRAGWGNF